MKGTKGFYIIENLTGTVDIFLESGKYHSSREISFLWTESSYRMVLSSSPVDTKAYSPHTRIIVYHFLIEMCT